MKTTFNVLDATKRPYDIKKEKGGGKGMMHTIQISEAAGKDRLNTELTYNLNDEEVGRYGQNLDSLIGKQIDVSIKELSIGYGGRMSARGILHLKPEQNKQ